MIKKIVLLLLFVIATGQLVSACSCMPHGPLSIKDFNVQPAIFIGKVKSVKFLKSGDSYDQNEIVFLVSTVFKGVGSEKEVKVYTNTNSAACGLTVGKGQQWLVYAGYYKGVLATNMCSRSVNMAYADQEELALLQSFASQKGTVWMQGTVKQGEGKLVNGFAEGWWKYYQPNGLIAAEGNYIKGEMDGKWTTYVAVDRYEKQLGAQQVDADKKLFVASFNYKLSDITHYKSGKKHGEFIEYDPNTSKITRIINFVNDEAHGLSINYYPSGLIEREANYQKNEQHGISRAYYTNGGLMYEGNFTEGIGGEFKVYDEQGKFLGTSSGPPSYDPETKKLALFKL